MVDIFHTHVSDSLGPAAKLLENVINELQEDNARLSAENEKLRKVIDNPRCYCPDCGADLGNFYSNRIRMERE